MPDYGTKATEDALQTTERRVRSVYAEAQRDVQAKMDSFVKRHRAKDQEYQMQLAEGKITQKQYEDWMRGQVFQGQMWESKLNSITNTLANSNSRALAIVNGQTRGVFAENANWTSYQMEHGAGIDFGFGLYDESTVNRLIRDNPKLLPNKKLNVPKDKAWNQDNITRQITQGVIQGEKLEDVAKRLQKVTNMNKNSALTNARTAMTGAQNAGRVESINRANRMGIKTRKEWLATLDGHTRSAHAKLDGQKVDHNKPFKVDGYTIMYPGDPQAHPSLVYGCRCTLIADLVDYPSENAKRYDNITGKLIKDLTYKEWEQMKTAKPNAPTLSQTSIGAARSVKEVEDLLNNSGQLTTPCSLDGCDLDSAKAIASSYEVVLNKFPQVKSKIGGVTAVDLGDKTYAQCYLYGNQRVEVNNRKGFYSNWSDVIKHYDHDVQLGFHPYGTTAESIVTHELGHAVSGLLSNAHALDAFTSATKYKSTSQLLRAKVAQSTGVSISDMRYEVSYYGSYNADEWFAECFAEYVTSANPRKVASNFGAKLTKLLEETPI